MARAKEAEGLERDTKNMEFSTLQRCSQANDWLRILGKKQDYRCGMGMTDGGMRKITIWLFQDGEAVEEISAGVD